MSEAKYIYIDKQADFDRACKKLAGAKMLALDTEFVGEKFYRPKLELIQMTAGEEVYLADAAALSSFAALGKLLGNAAITKIFHAADADLEILRRTAGAEPAPVFDTQVAASLLGYGAQISLVNLAKAALGARLSSKQTTSDWTHRPLSEDQLSYAADDVAHLHKLQEKLTQDLDKCGRLHWYDDEQRERLDRVLGEAEPDRELYRRVKGWVALPPQDLAVLRELTEWREQTARAKNQPRRSVLSDETLIELARFQPATREKAKRLRAVNVGQVLRFFDDIQGLIETGKKVPREEWPEKPAAERPDIPEGVLELCLALLRSEAMKLRVAPNVFATTSDLQYIINHRDHLDEKEIPLLHGWRREALGGKILDLLRGKVAVSVGKDGNLSFGGVKGGG